MTILEMLIEDEGLKLKPYHDHLGNLTIGIGRNLDARGITKDEAIFLCQNDIKSCIESLDEYIPWWIDLDESRKKVLINMCFQLGIGGLLGFREFLYQLERGVYSKAAEEMLKSKWAEQTPNRAKKLADIMRG